eukprot:1645660-Prymnesium_polylepis.2
MKAKNTETSEEDSHQTVLDEKAAASARSAKKEKLLANIKSAAAAAEVDGVVVLGQALDMVTTERAASVATAAASGCHSPDESDPEARGERGEEEARGGGCEGCRSGEG